MPQTFLFVLSAVAFVNATPVFALHGDHYDVTDKIDADKAHQLVQMSKEKISQTKDELTKNDFVLADHDLLDDMYDNLSYIASLLDKVDLIDKFVTHDSYTPISEQLATKSFAVPLASPIPDPSEGVEEDIWYAIAEDRKFSEATPRLYEEYDEEGDATHDTDASPQAALEVNEAAQLDEVRTHAQNAKTDVDHVIGYVDVEMDPTTNARLDIIAHTVQTDLMVTTNTLDGIRRDVSDIAFVTISVYNTLFIMCIILIMYHIICCTCSAAMRAQSAQDELKTCKAVPVQKLVDAAANTDMEEKALVQQI